MGARLVQAARRRLAAVRAGSEHDERGFALIFVLLVTTMITAAVATTLSVVVPNIASARSDQNGQAALAAAQAGIDDFIGYLTSTSDCRSTSKICTQALNASSGRTPVAIPGTAETFSWASDPTLTSDYDVRVRTVGYAGQAKRYLVADVALARGILSFGYYTDYESQSPAYLDTYFSTRHVYVGKATTYAQIDTRNTSNRTISVTSPTTANWYGSPTSGTNPYPATICGEHWYRDGSTNGRFSYGSTSVWGETGSVAGNSVIRTSSCDVVFTTGMTFDGPIYTRDALLLSNGVRNGQGPVFNQPVLSLWGYNSGSSSYNYPAPPATTPWRQDPSVGGTPATTSKYSPATATFDLRLPPDIGSQGLPTDACVYTGPTRIVLKGTSAVITSPQTTAPGTSADTSCYPTGSLAGGIVNWTLANYQSVGHGAIYVKNALAAGDTAPAKWPGNGASPVISASAAGGTAVPDKADSTVADDSGCSSSVTYSAAASWPCAWTGVATPSDTGTGSGWTSYSATTCGSATPTNRQLFECEYAGSTSTAKPALNQTGGSYDTLRTAIQTAIAGCAQGSTTCITAGVNTALATANSGRHAANYATPASGDHQYVVTGSASGSTTQGSAVPLGSTPVAPLSGDPLFATNATPAQEAASKTPRTVAVGRQVYGCYVLPSSGLTSLVRSVLATLGITATPGAYDASGRACANNAGNPGWGSGATTTNSAGAAVPQFTTTATQSDWSITAQGSATSYFPRSTDVTQYNSSTVGLHGTDWPGDLYIEGTNSGRLSLLAQNDAVITGDLQDAGSDPSKDAVDLVAGNNVRNFHPVQCADQDSTDLGRTSVGWCPNDITGLYQGTTGMETNGVLSADHPAMQYVNQPMAGQSTTCSTTSTTLGSRRIDAAVFALSGSLLTDNYNRGCPLGPLTVNGGIYQSHRGANGVQWEYQTTDTKRATSGYSLQFHYVDLQHAALPYTPPVQGDANGKIWSVVSVSAGSGS